jgi:hypothetical protein
MKTKWMAVAAAAVLASACTQPTRTDPLTLGRAKFIEQLESRFVYSAPKPAPVEVADRAAGQKADAEYLAPFVDYDRSYSPAAAAQARAELARLREEAALLTHEQFLLRVAHITALADNGHTTINENSFKKNTPRVPVRTWWFPDGLRILRAAPAHADLLGARVDTIDGKPVAEVFGAMREYMGGTETHRRLRLLAMLESPALLQAAGVARERDALTLAGLKDDGTPFERRIVAEDRDRSAPVSSTARIFFPTKDDNAEYVVSFFRPGQLVPLWLRDPHHLFSMSPLENKGLYVALGACADSDDERVSDFLAKVLERVAREKPNYVVIDFRMNGGGDYTKTYPFMPALLNVLPKDGRVYALTSGWTFSAAITTVGALKQFGGDQVVLVGEPVGDRLDFWAEGGSFVLPNSFISALFTSGRHNYTTVSCEDVNCYWLNLLYPVRMEALDPELPAPLTYAAYRAGRDPGMEAVEIHERAPRAPPK